MSIIVGEEDEREIIERGTIGMSTVDKTQDKGTKKHFCESLWKWVKCLINFLNDKLEKMLGWDKPGDKPDEDVPLDLQWDQWEEAWCSALNWDRKKLPKFHELDRKDDQKKKREQKPKDILKSFLSVETDEWTTNTWNRQVALFLLYSVFRTSYSTALKKKKKNYWLNFRCKRRFIYLIFYTIVGHVLLVALFFCLHFIGITAKQMLTIEGFALVVPVLSAIIIGKDLDIHKYQETWSRHSKYQYLRNQEMLRFMLCLEPYIDGKVEKNVDLFAKAILEIEGLNIVKFCDNLDNKEKGLLDEALALIQKKKD